MTEQTIPTPLTKKFTRAVDHARVLHAADVRKQTAIPYLSHVLAVSSIVLEHRGSEDQAIAALLHDAGEDHGGKRRIAAIRAEFGDTVADIVLACSDDLPADRAEKRGWWERKVAYLDHLEDALPEVALVSAADKLHNARAILTDHRDLGSRLWGRFNKDAGRSGSLWYYQRLAEIFDGLLAKGAPQLARELSATVTSLVDQVKRLEGVSESSLQDELTRSRATEAHHLMLMSTIAEPSAPPRRVSALTDPHAVVQAVAEFDRLGRTTFLDKYAYGPAREYWLVVDGREYDSKAIAGVAYGLQHPVSGHLRHDELSGGTSPGAAASVLEGLGFEIRRRSE